ncbi:MAG: hypothetical protein AABY64_09600 [Bdellovibrionota bacterium]
MNQYLVMIVIAALGVVAFINADSTNRTKFGKIETELLLPGPTITNGVTIKDEAGEFTFKCKKEVGTDEKR